MESKLTKSTENLILVDAQVIYPNSSIKVTLASPHRELLQIGKNFKTCDIMVNSSHEDQKSEALKSLNSLMTALNLKISELAIHQPAQVTAATYARLLQSVSLNNSLFTKPQSQLTLINVDVEKGISKHHHKQYLNYTFSSSNKTIERSKLQIDYASHDSWWYRSQLHPLALSSIPKDFLLWFNKDKQDRSDQNDFNLVAKNLNISNNYLLQVLFYQIKFEIADVICCPPFYNRLPRNLPANIFQREVDPNKSLTGLLIKYYRLHHARPTVKQIYLAGVHNRLPNCCWNGKWISNHH
ncbi:hypothetical protein [Limosilactobacillus reuteri]|uniref:Uncharacterized protein n=1 Tax=Limosilactobacillus reuteri TaxID=1598 RepID=A0A256SQE7_LIMRT|nr:hypothetical protein [Limosilactobacillus reuteri]OYS68799.1 hypothetical protein CBF96_06485 [Limosilactobacillus reuteri]